MTNPDFEERPTALIVLLPAADDPVNAASSEDIAHMTFVWFGDVSDGESEEGTAFEQERVAEELARYAAGTTPITVPVERRGELGDDQADVLFLEGTDSLMALRDGLMGESEAILAAHDATTQYPQWTPHVTLGYPDVPATAEYDGGEITFDRFALWVGDDRQEFPMGTTAITAAADIDIDVDDAEAEIPDGVEIDDEDMVDEPVIEIPVHGVATIEGKPTGDGRMFALGALTNRPLPLPLRYEFIGTHGGDTSMVAPVGRLDELWKVEVDGYTEYRYRGVIITTKQYANEALEGIIDGSLTGVSVETDDITVDVTEERERMRAMLRADRAAGAGDKPLDQYSDDELDAFIDDMIGDGTMNVTTFSSARVCGFTIVPIPAFHEGYIALGSTFPDEVTEEDKALLADAGCGCSEAMEIDWDQFAIVDLSVLSPEDLAHYDTLEPAEQDAWLAAEHPEAILSTAPAAFREYDAEQRKKMAESGEAMPDGSYPIADEEDLRNAIQAIGRAKDPEAAKAHIEKRARELGKEDLIPEDWAALVAAAFAPGTKDGPGWITHPRATARIRRYWTKGKGAAKIRWGEPGDFNRCRSQLAKYVANPNWLAGLCANMHFEVLGFWPAQHHAARGLAASAAAARSSVDAMLRLVEFEQLEPVAITAGAGWPDAFPSEFFQDPKLTELTPLTITDDGRVYGHVAGWTSCHVGMEGICQNPPASSSDYAYFMKGVVDTDAGPQRVGTLTYGVGHAGLRANMEQATAHYDKPDAVRAYVAVGNDGIGMWYSGVVRPGVTDDQIREFRALGAISGDWRWVGRELELIAVTAVNAPGYQIARRSALVAAAGGHQLSLITPPVVAEREDAAAASAPSVGTEEFAGHLRAAVREVLEERDAAPRIAAVRAQHEAYIADKLKSVRQFAVTAEKE